MKQKEQRNRVEVMPAVNACDLATKKRTAHTCKHGAKLEPRQKVMHRDVELTFDQGDVKEKTQEILERLPETFRVLQEL